MSRSVEPQMPELALSKWWHAADLSDPLSLESGGEVSIVFRGRWSHGLGPDFQEAMITFDRRNLIQGDIEIHLRSSDWHSHGHHADPRYNDVVLHVVLRDDGGEVRRADGRQVPTVVVSPDPDELSLSLESGVDWSIVGGETCAEDAAATRPERLVGILLNLGDNRLNGKMTAFESRCGAVSPAQALYEGVMDALGYSNNREPMKLLSSLLPMRSLEQAVASQTEAERVITAESLLLGVGGFFPLSPTIADLLGYDSANVNALERAWEKNGQPWHYASLRPRVWAGARVRPANHPAVRLSAAAALFAGKRGGLSEMLREVIEADDPVEELVNASIMRGHRRLGKGRASAILANVFLPFVLGTSSDRHADQELMERAMILWESMPVIESNSVAKRAARQVAGRQRLPGLGIRGQQGLIYLDRELCTPRRCFECPVAHHVLFQSESGRISVGDEVKALDAIE